MDTVCPTAAELPDVLRRGLPTITWAAHHRARRVPMMEQYENELARGEVAGLLAQAAAAQKSPTPKPHDANA